LLEEAIQWFSCMSFV